MDQTRKLKLGTFLTTIGEHIAAWRHPTVGADENCDFASYLRMAKIAEDALFDMILVADVAASTDDPIEALSRLWVDHLDPLVLISALAVATTHIGLTATASTTYNEPYHVARKIASVDHLSRGRAGWNLVTTMNESDAYNFNREHHAKHGDRYDRAEEFVDVVLGLWDSWDDDAFVRDKASGRYFRPEALHLLQHKGRHFSVRGPLDIPRTPQGRPVIVQAGSSDSGRALSARRAEVIFTQQRSLAAAQEFCRDVRQRAAKFGRSPDELVILVGVQPVIGRSQQDAANKLRELEQLIHPAVGISQLSKLLGAIDLSPYPLDRPLPDDLPHGNGTISRRQSIIDLGRREGLTMLELALRVSGSRGHLILEGTAASIADQMEEWFRAGAADGFLLVPACLPDSLQEFADEVVPELQRRGLFRTRYEGTTLRENLGLKRPAPHRNPGAASFAVS